MSKWTSLCHSQFVLYLNPFNYYDGLHTCHQNSCSHLPQLWIGCKHGLLKKWAKFDVDLCSSLLMAGRRLTSYSPPVTQCVALAWPGFHWTEGPDWTVCKSQLFSSKETSPGKGRSIYSKGRKSFGYCLMHSWVLRDFFERWAASAAK